MTLNFKSVLVAIGSLVLLGCASPWYHKRPYYCWVFVNTQMINDDGSRAKNEGQYYIKTRIEDVKQEELGKRTYTPCPGYESQGYWILEGPFPPLDSLPN